ncbi:universal stress protein [Actinomadura sp. 21ATH]|uniref:universal stress protein n=1 Tax=Actinomadura sp. 21ATH TaxID=1735444 RepID=UPI0035C18AD5
MNEIVVGVDGSEPGMAAVDRAAWEAVLRNAPLRVVHSAPPWLFHPPATHRLAAVRDWMYANGEEILRRALARARGKAPGVRASGEQIGGQAADVLIRESAEAAMVVVGGHGAGALADLLLGSAALQVVSHAVCPAVDVRPGGDAHAQDPTGEIVVGVDGSPGSADALGFAFEEAALRKAPLRALLARSRPASQGPGDMQPLVHDPAVVMKEERALTEFVAGWVSEYPDVAFTHQVVHARPARALVEASAGAGLLVVGARGRGGFSGLLLGSVGHAVLHRARCPVAVVPHRRR